MQDDNKHDFTYTLPNLVTSTDECTVFISSDIINIKESWNFCRCPTDSSQPFQVSSKRDVYSATLSGDAHIRGIRIVLNNAFTAGGLYAPIFACEYGLTLAEMPKDEIVVQKIKGLVAGSDQSGSTQEGFIVFVRGNYEPIEDIEKRQKESTNLPSQHPDSPVLKMCNEACIAKLYKGLVYYPMIEHICTAFYKMDPKSETVPDKLSAISWMDG